jgi:hypothetical protein
MKKKSVIAIATCFGSGMVICFLSIVIFLLKVAHDEEKVVDKLCILTE